MTSISSPPPLPIWAVYMATPPPSPTKSLKNSSIPDPPGFTACSGKKRSQQSASSPLAAVSEPSDTLKLKKAWEIALAPTKQIPMNAIMMYMSGNSLQIFSIMMVWMLFKGPITGIWSTNTAFAKFESKGLKGRLLGVKAVYVLMQLVLLAMGVWKVNKMGLLPTTRSDWLAWEYERQPLERAAFAF
ncbi:hypothetical protein KEM54_005407 [Ascosphaera aggregata]|nr:hypothetical protein KEM54_005407 [Ascosphaera aggregata]